MRLPTPLLRRKKDVHKNDFGHVLILAGSRRLLGAAALSSLAAMRSGAGLVTVGIPESLNSVIQKKISSVVMTLPLPQTPEQSLALPAFGLIQKFSCDALAMGPGLSRHPETEKLILKIIGHTQKPVVIDADALNALATNMNVLRQTRTLKILTPHPGEMARLTKLKTDFIESKRLSIAKEFAAKFRVIVVLKGHRSVVASPDGRVYVNTTGNPGMATAGSGDVLTGMIAAFLAQGLKGFEAAKIGCYLHGKAGDLAAKQKMAVSLIATDIIENIPQVIGKERKHYP